MFYLLVSLPAYIGSARRASPGGQGAGGGQRARALPSGLSSLAASTPTPAETDTARPRGSARRGLRSQPPGSPCACTLGAKGTACVPTMAKLLNISAPHLSPGGVPTCSSAWTSGQLPGSSPPPGPGAAKPGSGITTWPREFGPCSGPGAEAPVVPTPRPGGHRCRRGRGWGAVAQQRLPWPGLSGVGPQVVGDAVCFLGWGAGLLLGSPRPRGLKSMGTETPHGPARLSWHLPFTGTLPQVKALGVHAPTPAAPARATRRHVVCSCIWVLLPLPSSVL